MSNYMCKVVIPTEGSDNHIYEMPRDKAQAIIDVGKDAFRNGMIKAPGPLYGAIVAVESPRAHSVLLMKKGFTSQEEMDKEIMAYREGGMVPHFIVAE